MTEEKAEYTTEFGVKAKHDKEIELVEKLTELPDNIKTQQAKVVSLSITLEEKRKQSKTTEMIVSSKIASDTTLTNEIKRKAAISESLSNDGSYQELLTDTTILEAQLRAEQIELDYLHNLFRAFTTIAQIRGVK